MTKALLYLTLIIFAFTSKSYAQDKERESISLDETLKYINAKFEGKIVVDLKGGDISSKTYDDKNRVFKIDHMDTEHINFRGIYYDEDNAVIVIPCDGNSEKCCEREMVLYKEKAEYSRSTLKMTDPVKAAGIIKALQHIVQTVEDHTYKSLTPFDEVK